MKQNKSKPIKKITKILLITIGAILLIWTISWFTALNSSNNFGELLITAIFFSIGLYAIIIFITIIIIYKIIKFIIKKIRRIK